jgi:hypothetical protein
MWCNMIHLILNIIKCKFIKFGLIKNPINFPYCIFNSNIELVSQFNDLGKILDSKLNFSSHTDQE